jgi:hypothetical protein
MAHLYTDENFPLPRDLRLEQAAFFMLVSRVTLHDALLAYRRSGQLATDRVPLYKAGATATRS